MSQFLGCAMRSFALASSFSPLPASQAAALSMYPEYETTDTSRGGRRHHGSLAAALEVVLARLGEGLAVCRCTVAAKGAFLRLFKCNFLPSRAF